MTIQDVGITFLIMAVIGCYVYVQRAVDDMRKRQQKTEDCVEKAVKDMQKALTDLTIVVTNRLTAIETQLGIQLPKKGASGEGI